MEVSSVRRTLAYAGEEKYQMLELNRRLESYLKHVKFLEEENQLLWGEIQALRKSQTSRGWVNGRDEELSLARKEVQDAWREKDRMELEISNLLAEMEELNRLRLNEVAAQVQAKKKVEESRKTLEDERRIHIWLRERASHLEKEVSLELQIHQEDMEAVQSSLAFTKPVLKVPPHRPALNLQGLGDEYSQRAAQIWQETAGRYQVRVEKLEESLNQTRTDMVQMNQEKKESKVQMQALAQELEATRVKREILEKNLVRERDRQKQELQHLQVEVETLEVEKVETSEQISQLMLDRQNLLHMKMSLGLEVATYRALLDNESCRDKSKNQSTSKDIRTFTLSERLTRPPGKTSALQTFSSGLLGTHLHNTMSRSIARKVDLMTQTSSGTPARGASNDPPEKAPITREEQVESSEEKIEVKSSVKTFTASEFLDHYRAKEAPEEPSWSGCAPEPADLNIVEESEVKDEAVQDASAPEEKELITLQTGNGSRSPDTPGREELSRLHTDDGDEEVSTEMSQITHAPVSAWEENDPAVLEERDAVSEIELEFENVTGSGSELQHQEENITKPAAVFDNETLAESFSCVEINDNKVDRVISADVEENYVDVNDEEQLMFTHEVGNESNDELEDVEGLVFDINMHAQETQPESEEGKVLYIKTQDRMLEVDIDESLPPDSSVPEVDCEINKEDTKLKSEPMMDTNHTDQMSKSYEKSLNITSQPEGPSNRFEGSADVEANNTQYDETELLICTLEVGFESPENIQTSEVLEDLRDVEELGFDINMHKRENQPKSEEDNKKGMMEEDVADFNYLEKKSIPQVNSVRERNTEDTEQISEPVMDTSHTDPQFHRKSYELLNISNQPFGLFSHDKELKSVSSADVEENNKQFVEMCSAKVGIESLENIQTSEVLEDLRDVEELGFEINVQSQPETEEEKQEGMMEDDVPESTPQTSPVQDINYEINTKDTEQKPDHTTEDLEQSDEESLNISASWRTDPGDVDSYAQENTLADTRPLIHYRSDDEADGYVEISRQGTGEATDSEDDDRREGLGHWSQKIAKRFDTMEDLSEEPEIRDDTVTDGSVQTVHELDEMKENMDEEFAHEDLCQRKSLRMDDDLVCYPDSDLTMDGSQVQEGTSKNSNNDLLIEKLDDLSESLVTDTSGTTELQNPTDQFNSSEEDLIKDYTVNWDLESMNFKTEPENVNQPLFGSLPPVIDEPLAEEEVSEETSMMVKSTSDDCPQDIRVELSTLINEDVPLPKKVYQQLVRLDVEESNSSEDESPNASRCSQLRTHTETTEIPPQHLDWNLSSIAGETLENDPKSFSGFLDEAQKDHGTEYPDNVEESVITTNEGIDVHVRSLSNAQEWTDSAGSTAAPQPSFSTVEEPGDQNPDSSKDKMNILERDLREGSDKKENDVHTYFSSSITEVMWTSAATYHQDSERVSNGSKGFQNDWEDFGRVLASNGKPENEMGISTGQSVEGKREERVRVESTDDGDSWSSGEE